SATNTWTAFGGGGGSGTVNSGTANQLAYYAATGTAVSGAHALPNGTTASTQIPVDISTKVTNNLFVQSQIARAKSTATVAITGGTYNTASAGTGAVINWTATGGTITSIGTIFNGASGYLV